ncbi:AAA family ATPase [Leeuwenhoekiella parthenopeia]|uniref:AAA family ATPase n=1 Tax=Leeuwenhoekiella parthenopeia TaxID=2890320 RepID=A0ABS8GUW7_9FLAO|nr:AAA family ATPase [Leeuwenhoekiella parthenopeia]MCC4213573.1 AAA family ATPase [Leeuwenhoekiella parthenopeia]
MKISIENFKSIHKVQGFEIKPLTLLSGVNSAGKSSFFQILLLLKHSIEQKSQNRPLDLSGGLYETSSFNDLIHNHDAEKNIKISFLFSKKEYQSLDDRKTTKFFDSLGGYSCEIDVHFSISSNKIIISLFQIEFKFDEDTNKYIRFYQDKNLVHKIETNTPTFIDENFTADIISELNVEYNSIFPNQISYKQKVEDEDLQGRSTTLTEEFYKVVNVSDTKKLISRFFESIHYIGPSRKEPQESYTFKRENFDVGKYGENTSQILKDQSERPITHFVFEENNKGEVEYIKKESSLIEAVNYWICKKFVLAKEIWSEEDDGKYRILLKYGNDLIVNIKHVGYGISQILPIIVQGLLMNPDKILMIEQPELHLHPKIQSKLYDFLYSLTLSDKKLIVETHSSHFITRMRRRIAEDLSNEMDDKINLTFIENSLFRTLELNDYGTILNYYPKDFIEHPSKEMRAIVEAQIKKRKINE